MVELHTDRKGIDGSAVAGTRRRNQSRSRLFLVQAAVATSTQSGLERSEVGDPIGLKCAVIFPQNVTVFEASQTPQMRKVDEGKEALQMPPPTHSPNRLRCGRDKNTSRRTIRSRIQMQRLVIPGARGLPRHFDDAAVGR